MREGYCSRSCLSVTTVTATRLVYELQGTIRLLLAILTNETCGIRRKRFVQKLWQVGLLCFVMNSGCTKVTAMASFRLQ